MGRFSLRRVEAGEPGVLMGTYMRVLGALGLAQDLVLLARDDMIGRPPQDEALACGADTATTAAPKKAHHAQTQLIRLADYPMLCEVAWGTDREAELTPSEALALYERNWRHIDSAAMTPHERDLVERLTKTVGKGVLLV